MSIRSRFRPYTVAPMTHSVVMEALSSYGRPNDKISEMVRSGELISLRRGLYIAGRELDLPQPHPFLIANHMRGPSYVSLETALAYHGLIPERVYEIASVTMQTTRTYENEIGRFSYQHLNTPYYSLGIERREMAPQQMALVACPEKALCDLIIVTSGLQLRSVIQARNYLLEDLRIATTALRGLDADRIEAWLPEAPKRASLENVVRTIRGL